VHHHVHYLPDGALEKWLLMEDAGPFWKTMLDLNVELILHGHKHYATNAVIRYLEGRNEGQERELMILAGGTACSKDLPPGQQHCYYRIEANAFKCKVRKHAHVENAFRGEPSRLVFRTWLGIDVPGADGSVSVAALDSILVSDDEDMDANDYRRIAHHAKIDAARGYRSRFTLEGTNTARQPYLRVPLVIVGVRGRTLDPKAWDIATKTPLEVETVLHPRNVDKVYLRISLPAGMAEATSSPSSSKSQFPT
jgi:hypothetical protein